MLRSRISRTNSKLEIFTGIVDCRQKKTLSFSKSLLLDLHFTFFISFISRQNYLLFCPSPYSPMSPALLEIFQSHLGTLVSSFPMMPCAKRLTFFMGFGFFEGFEGSNSDTWGQKIFSISKNFWLQNAHKPNTKMQFFLITIVRRFFFLIWP